MKKKTSKLITVDKLSAISGVKVALVATYIKHGLLIPVKQDEEFNRYFEKDESAKRIREIKKMEKNGYKLSEIEDRFRESRYAIVQEAGFSSEKIFKNEKERQKYINYLINQHFQEE